MIPSDHFVRFYNEVFITQIEVLAGTIGNDLSTTTPNANTPITNQTEENLNLTGDSLLYGVTDVKSTPLVWPGLWQVLT